jgi:chitinase
MSGYYQPELYHWDSSAQAAYLSITNVNPASDMFISYDDQRTCQSKVSYARNRSLGGVMIWELAQDFQAGQPDPLLEAVKQSLAAPGLVNLQPASTDVVLTFNGIALGSYSVQWTSNFTAGVWNTLLITNVLNAGGVLKVIDPAAILNQPQRFYRVKTPP